MYPKIDAAIIKVVGIFDYNKSFQREFLNNTGYIPIPISSDDQDKIKKENAIKFFRDKYYKEYNSLLLTRGVEEKSIPSFQKTLNFELKFSKRRRNGEDVILNPKVSKSEIFLFEGGIGVFALTIDAPKANPDFEDYSDLLFYLRSFSSKDEISNLELHQWISKNIINGISLRTENGKNNVESDEFSGSKFKIYSAFSVNEADVNRDYNRDYLLFEIGTGSLLGSAGGDGYYAPSMEYYEDLMEFRVSAFKSWTGLALLDSYTVIGQDLLIESNGNINGNALSTHERIYFSIYLFNLYIKYNVFRFNSKFKDDPVRYKSRFEDFINEYNYSHISFDFLPNMIYSKMRAALGIEQEIKFFEKRLNSLAANIQEEQEKRQAALLGIISIISSISAIEPILETTEQVREYTGFDNNLFYVLLTVLAVAVAIPILSYLFPHYAKKIWKKLNSYFTHD